MPFLAKTYPGCATRLSLRTYVVCAALAASLTLAGCDATGSLYVKNGIGTELPSQDIRTVSELQSTYFDYLCLQAGITAPGHSGEIPHCDRPVDDWRHWTLIVHQGLNDIDRRCDAYLSWLDHRKRARGALIGQLDALETATTGILAIANPPPGRAVAVVAQAFGLAAASVDNYHSLLFEIESSTVNSVVLKEQHRFRSETANFTYQTRPAAEYTLRSYLRICLPFAIETQINDLSTLASKGIVIERESSITQSPANVRLAGAGPIMAETLVDRRPPERPRVGVTGWDTVSDLIIDLTTAKGIQTAMCFPPPSTDGAFGAKTAAALRIFEVENNDLDKKTWTNARIWLSPNDVALLRNGRCIPGANNFLENQLLTEDKAVGIAISAEIRKRAQLPDSNKLFPELRAEIKKIRSDLNLTDGPGNMFEGQITPDLYSALLKRDF